MNISELIAQQFSLRVQQVAATIALLDDGNTIPFIARYRKEATQGLNEDQIRAIQEELERLRALEERRHVVLKTIEDQGKLTDELKAAILACTSRTALEDLYQPYKPKRRTRASVARERGLQPLADLILQQALIKDSLDKIALPFLNEEVPTAEEAWAGARDIVAETISDHPEVRRITREKTSAYGIIRSEKVPEAQDSAKTYEVYYEFEARLAKIKPHQVLAINRGEAEKVLRVRVQTIERDWQNTIDSFFKPNPRSPLAEQLALAIQDGAERLLLPAIERDIRRSLTEKAEQHAIRVFAENLRALLFQPPLAGHTVMGIDPGFRTGCKVAVVENTGRLLETATIMPHEPQKKWDEALAILQQLIERHGVSLISIGNGTASRETEQLVAELTRKTKNVRYMIVSEAGASVYSASPLAKHELPDLDVSLRGAVSIARRVQDPLAELVKIEPRSIGIGLYQHDVDQKALAHTLDGVVESVVNQVGVDVNTASAALLAHVAGIGAKCADQIVAYRDKHGAFKEREELKAVTGLGSKAFQQAAGFLRIRGGNNPLDGSAIHPESYPIAEAIMKLGNFTLDMPLEERRRKLDYLRKKPGIEQLARELQCGVPTMEDIFEQLIRPGRDPRQDVPAPILRSDVLKMEDLVNGMSLKGTVRNVVDFGAFVDIGVKQDGLLHRSQFPPNVELKVGDCIDVIIQKVEVERGRIALSWKKGSNERVS